MLARLRTAEADFAAQCEASLERWYAGTDVGADLVARTEATLLANDRDSFLNCYRVFATADPEIGPELAAHHRAGAGHHRRARPGLHAGHDPPAGRGHPRLPSSRRPRRPAHAARRTPPELVDCLTTFIGEYAHV